MSDQDPGAACARVLETRAAIVFNGNVAGAWVRKVGVLGVSFFFVKGMLWVLVPWALSRFF